MDYLESIHTQNYYNKMSKIVPKTKIRRDKVALAASQTWTIGSLEFLSGTETENSIYSLLKGAGRNDNYNKTRKQKWRLGGTEEVK